MSVVALLPMKGNSERVPNKNMRSFDGAPLYHAVMNSLLASDYIEKVVINTDSDIISKDAVSNFGDRVQIINRPFEIQGDYVSMNEIINYDLSVLDSDVFIQTHSTNPLVRSETFDKGIEKYYESVQRGFDSVFSVTKLQTRLYDRKAEPMNHNPNELIRTQDLDTLYEENSNFYIFSRSSFIEATNKRIGLKPSLFVVNKLESLDIDEPEDFQLAELLHVHKDKF